MDSELLQRFMRRLDHIEFTVGRDLQHDNDQLRHEFSQLQSTVGNIQRARRSVQPETGPTLPPVGSHRGPGALHVAADPVQALAPVPARTAAEPAPTTQALSIHEGNMLERQVSQARSAMSSPGPRGAFSNVLVKSRTEQFTISTPPSGVVALAQLPVPAPALAPPAPATEDMAYQSPVPARPATTPQQPMPPGDPADERPNAHGQSCHAGTSPDVPQYRDRKSSTQTR